MGDKKQRIIPAHYSWNSSIFTRGVIDPIKRKLGWVDENEHPVSLKESATGQELDRMKDTAKGAGKIVLTGLAFGNPITAGSNLGAAAITGSQAYFMTEGLKDAYNRVMKSDKTAEDGAMVALDVAGAVPAVGAVKNGYRFVAPEINNILKRYNLYGPDGKIFHSRIVKNPNNFYRIVGEDAIIDAETSGLIRGNPITDSIHGPYFQPGTPHIQSRNIRADINNVNGKGETGYKRFIIEGTPTSADRWIDSWRAGSRRPLIEQRFKDTQKFPYLYGDDEIAFWKELHDTQYKDFNKPIIENIKALPYLKEHGINYGEFGTEVFPMTNGKLEAPTSNFVYYKEYPLFGWRQKLFKPKQIGEQPSISKSLGFSSTTGEELFMPNEILGEFAAGKNQAAKFFQQPVVQNSYTHNKELAARLGITIADRPKNISEIVGAPINLGPYIQNPENELANIAQSYLGDPNAKLSIAWTPFSKRVAKLTGIHEGLHRGHYAQAIKPAPPIAKNYFETTMRPEATFWNWKVNKLLKPEYQNSYLSGPWDGEAGVNLIEMGRDMGVKLGTKYPGDEVFMNMINNYNGHKSFLVPHLNLDTRAGRRHVWDAMTGQYFKQGGIVKRVESGKSGIHIKPENRGKFTALKKRTGKSSTWYKEHGTPAQKKMAVFALNARKWKHK